MAKANPFVDYLLGLLAGVGDVRARRMFGGYGIYRDDVMFGIVAEGSLYLKADDENRPLFEQAGCVPFCYYRKGRNEPIHLSYYEAPPEAVDRAEALRPWADHALAAARRTNGKKRR